MPRRIFLLFYQHAERSSRSTAAITGNPTGSFLPSGIWRYTIDVPLFVLFLFFYFFVFRMDIKFPGRLAVTDGGRPSAGIFIN